MLFWIYNFYSDLYRRLYWQKQFVIKLYLDTSYLFTYPLNFMGFSHRHFAKILHRKAKIKARCILNVDSERNLTKVQQIDRVLTFLPQLNYNGASSIPRSWKQTRQRFVFYLLFFNVSTGIAAVYVVSCLPNRNDRWMPKCSPIKIVCLVGWSRCCSINQIRWCLGSCCIYPRTSKKEWFHRAAHVQLAMVALSNPLFMNN